MTEKNIEDFNEQLIVEDKPKTHMYAELDDNGAVIAFHEQPSDELVKITIEEWENVLSNPSGWRVLDGKLTPYKTPHDPVQAKIDAKQFVKANIDEFKEVLLGKYTATEQAGWTTFLPEAKAFLASSNPEDAPGLSLQAAIQGAPLEVVARGITLASKITGLLPHLAAGIRSRASALIDATDGSYEAIEAVKAILATKQQALAIAIQKGDEKAVLAAATTGWE